MRLIPLALIAAVHFGGQTTPAFAELDPALLCPVIGELAETVMLKRQEGVTMSAAMAVMAEVSKELPEFQGFLNAMVIEAWGRGHYMTAEAKARAIVDFRNDIELECYKAAP